MDTQTALDIVGKVKEAAPLLKKDGYAVIRGVFTKEECGSLVDRMWQHWSDASNGKLRREASFKSMKAMELPPHQHGIIQSYRSGYFETVREIRTDPRIILVYATLYATGHLTGSIDRVNWKFPGRPYRSVDAWPHADQDAGRTGAITYQSYITLLPCSKNSPGNRFYSGSNNLFDTHFAYRRDDEQARKKNGKNDWLRLSEKEAKNLGKQCPLVKPECEAGDLVIWDSRTVHSPTDGSDFRDGRFVVYTCYNKLWEKARDEEFKAAKRAVFNNRRASSHSPLPIQLFPPKPRIYDNNNKNPYIEIPLDKLGGSSEPSEREAYLYCFKDYDLTDKKESLAGKVLFGESDWKEKFEIEEPLLTFVSPYTPLKGKESASSSSSSKKRERGEEAEEKKKEEPRKKRKIDEGR